MRNLYFQSRRFRDFNFTDCLERVESVSHHSLVRSIQRAYDDSEPPDPCFDDTLVLSLRAETADAYRKRFRAPIENRDFLLSKLFQFLYDPLRIQNQLDEPGALPLRRRLELWLDGLPETVVTRLHRFHWHGFFQDSLRLDRKRLLARLDRYLPPLRRKRSRTPYMGQRGPVPNVGGLKAVAEAVRKVGKGWRLKAGLLEVAVRLDDAGAAPPARWAKLNPPATTWRSAAQAHPKHMRKNLEYRLSEFIKLSERNRELREQGEAEPATGAAENARSARE